MVSVHWSHHRRGVLTDVSDDAANHDDVIILGGACHATSYA